MRPRLAGIFIAQWREMVPNYLDHIKILPLYLQRGYPREEFIIDYDDHKFPG